MCNCFIYCPAQPGPPDNDGCNDKTIIGATRKVLTRKLLSLETPITPRPSLTQPNPLSRAMFSMPYACGGLSGPLLRSFFLSLGLFSWRRATRSNQWPRMENPSHQVLIVAFVILVLESFASGQQGQVEHLAQPVLNRSARVESRDLKS